MKQVWVDEEEGEEEGIADVLFDDNSIATVARPGTSLRSAPPPRSPGVQSGPSQAIR